MSLPKKFTYEPLESHDDASDALPSYEPNLEPYQSRRRWSSIVMIWFVIQASNIILLSGGYALWQFTRSKSNGLDLDRYFELAEYNTTKYFMGNTDLVAHSPVAEQFWDRIQDSGGVVSIDTEWAAQHFAPSKPSPQHPDESIYQVDVFHTIHCLYRIRNRLLANTSLQPEIDTDSHTLHCVDWIREQVMCHSDISLRATDDFITFGDLSHGHQCRDHDALVHWIAKYQWEGHKDYLEMHHGTKFKHAMAASPVL